MNIFISYRREDSEHTTGRIYQNLADCYSEEHVFKDVDSLVPGENFPDSLEKSIALSDVVLAIIGKKWAEIEGSDGRKRLFNSEDYVRKELELALKNRKKIIPVVVEGAVLPSVADVPASIRPVFDYHSIKVRPDPDFKSDFTRLQASIGKPRKTVSHKIAGVMLASIGIVAVALYLVFRPVETPEPIDNPITTTPVHEGGQPDVVVVPKPQTNFKHTIKRTDSKTYSLADNSVVDDSNSFWVAEHNELEIFRKPIGPDREASDFTYGIFANRNKVGTYEIFIESFLDDDYVRTSNTISFVIDEPDIKLTSDNDYTITRSKDDVEQFIELDWVVMHDSKKVLTRNAVSEIKYNYFDANRGRLGAGHYSVYVEALVNGKRKQVSNILTFDLKAPDMDLQIDADNSVHRELLTDFEENFWNLQWVAQRDGDRTFARGAAHEPSFSYHVDKTGQYSVFMQAFIEGEYKPISNTVSYKID